MRQLLKILSYAGLALTLLPSFLVFANVIELQTHKTLMLLGSALWFFTAPFWLNKRGQEPAV